MQTLLPSAGLKPCATFLVLLLFPGALFAQPAESKLLICGGTTSVPGATGAGELDGAKAPVPLPA